MRSNRALTAVLAVCMASSNLIAQPAVQGWDLTLTGFGNIEIRDSAITPLPTGELLMHGTAGGQFVTSRHLNVFSRIGEARPLLPAGDYLFQVRDRGVDVQPVPNDSDANPGIVQDSGLNQLCSASRDFNGIDGRLFSADLVVDFRHPGGASSVRLAAFSPGGSIYRISLFDQDCDRTDVAEVASILAVQIRQATADRGYALAFPGPNSRRQRPLLLSITRDGIAWQRELNETDPILKRVEFAATPDGGVVLYQPSDAILREYDAEGVELWSTSVSGMMSDLTHLFRQGPLTILAARKSDSSGGVVKTFAGDGSLLGTRDLTGMVQYRLLPSAGAQLVFREEPVSPGGATLPVAEGLATVDAEGQWHRILDQARGYAPVARSSDGDIFARLASQPLTLSRINAVSGSASIGLDRSLPAPVRLAGVHHDGDSVFLVQEDALGHLRLRHLDRAGNQRWLADLPDPLDVSAFDPSGAPDYEMASSDALICIRRYGSESAVICRRRSSGAANFGWISDSTLPGTGTLWFDTQGLLNTLSIKCAPLVACFTMSANVRKFTSGTGSSNNRYLGGWPGNDDRTLHFVEGHHRLAVGHEGALSEIKVFDLDGRLEWERGSNPRSLRPIGFDTEGRLLAVDSAGAPSVLLLLLNGAGIPVWIKPIEAPVHQPGSVDAVALADGDWVAIEAHETGSSGQHTSRSLVTRRSGDTGELVWSHWVRDRGPGSLSVVEASGIALITEAAPAPARAVAIDLATGEVRSALPIGKPQTGANGFDQSFTVFTQPIVALDDDGFAIVSAPDFAANSVDVEARPWAAWLDSDAPPPASATRGIWSAEDSGGQGLFLDLYAFTDQAFGGWFTYGLEGGHVASELRWYTLLSHGAAGTETTFDIYRNDAGQFAAPPVTSATIVGSATLRLLSCDRAFLTYRFTEGMGAFEGEGAIPLRRSAGSGCDDAPQPRGTGAWFRPEQSGQGLFFLPTAEQQGGHQFAAAWFTYDPAGQADDELAQSWFTLLGDIGDDGRGTLTIYRTLGGAFDRGRTDNSRALGTVEVTLDGCDAMRLDYAFAPGLHAYAGRQGSIDLTRLGNCSQP